MVIFHSYVKLPEGNGADNGIWIGDFIVFIVMVSVEVNWLAINQQQEYDGDLVLWNMTGLWLSIQLGMECHHPNWLSLIYFSEGLVETTKQ